MSDAITMLKDDHRKVEKAFKKYEKMSDGDYEKKKELADHICDELTVHMKLEEEIFYPAVKEGIKSAEDIVNEGVVEHSGAKVLISEIQGMKGNEELFDSKVKVLAEQIEHHVKEEEGEMFPKVQNSKLDTVELGKEMAHHKKSLQ